MVDLKKQLNKPASDTKKISHLLFLIFFIPAFYTYQTIVFNDDVIDGIYLTGIGITLGLITPFLYFRACKISYSHNKHNPTDKPNQHRPQKIHEAPYIYIASVFVGIISVSAVNNCFSISERTEQFRVVELGNKRAGRASYPYAILKSGDKKVLYRLSNKDQLEEQQFVEIRIKKGILGFWHP